LLTGSDKAMKQALPAKRLYARDNFRGYFFGKKHKGAVLAGQRIVHAPCDGRK
jgi:hypothetical protein